MFSTTLCMLSILCGPLPQTDLPEPPSQSTLPINDAYSIAHARALSENKSLIVWVGGNFCPRCVEDSKNEFVHHFTEDWNGQRGPATVIYTPYEGELYHTATVEKWTVGSPDWGHIPSARRVVTEWRERVRQGAFEPLRMLNFGDGSWGMSHGTFWRNYQGSSYNSNRRMRSNNTTGGVSNSRGNC